MPHIVVCSLARLHDTVKAHGARDVVTLITANTPVERPPQVSENRHLHLNFHDITVPTAGMTPPAAGHVEAVIDFARAWDQQTPMVIHCFAGVSRSTAAAYISAVALKPELDEDVLARELRRRSASATPNIRLIGFADDLLGRSGRMVRAIERIGRGEDAYEGDPFILPLTAEQVD